MEAQSEKLLAILKQEDASEDQAKQLIEAFGAPFLEVGEILTTYKDIEVTDVNQKDLMKEAGEKRKALKNVRVGIEKMRKELKADALKTGRIIDAVAKVAKEAIEPAEEYLLLQENYAKILEQNRIAAIKEEREGELAPFVDDVSIYNLVEMSQDEFQKLVEERMRITADEEEAQRAATQAEEEAQEALAKKNKELEEENEKLRKVQEAQEDADKVKAKQEEILQQAPEKDKLIAWADALLNTPIPQVESTEAMEIVNKGCDFLAELVEKIKEKAGAL